MDDDDDDDDDDNDEWWWWWFDISKYLFHVGDFFFKNMKMKISTDKLRNYLLFEGVNFGKTQYETCFFVNLLLLFNE